VPGVSSGRPRYSGHVRIDVLFTLGNTTHVMEPSVPPGNSLSGGLQRRCLWFANDGRYCSEPSIACGLRVSPEMA
jgi:hypothetical protein